MWIVGVTSMIDRFHFQQPSLELGRFGQLFVGVGVSRLQSTISSLQSSL